MQSLPPLFYCAVPEEPRFESALVTAALRRSLLETVHVKYFYRAVNENFLFSLPTSPAGKDGDSYTGFQAIPAAAQLLI